MKRGVTRKAILGPKTREELRSIRAIPHNRGKFHEKSSFLPIFATNFVQIGGNFGVGSFESEESEKYLTLAFYEMKRVDRRNSSRKNDLRAF